MEQSNGFDFIHRDEFERNGKWLLARRSLGVSSFGINLVDLEPGESIPEHNELQRDQEEVFAVISGTLTMVIEGTEYEAPAGTFVRFDPELQRTAVNRGSEVATMLLVSAPRTSGYTPMPWS
jgi:uncharacterized cupin superfamily protein